MPTRSIDAAFEGLHLYCLIALQSVIPIILDGVRVRDEPAFTITVDIRAAGALSELARVTGLLRRRPRRAAEDVTWIDAEQQSQHQNDQSGTAANRDLPASASAAATHLRRIKLGTLVVFHISPTASLNSSNAAAMLLFLPRTRPRHTCQQRLAQWATVSVTVEDNPLVSRYEARIDGALGGVSEYELADNTIIFLHTVVAQKYEGQGVGGAIARSALDDARARGLHVRALCPFIRSWMERHPEYSDLISPA